jgi:nucleoside 2-deoxyribosyltransferase
VIEIQQLYLAGPYGFSEISLSGIERLKGILNQFFKIIDPFQVSPTLSQEIIQLEQQLSLTPFSPQSYLPANQIQIKLQQLNMTIGSKNAEFIANSAIIFAILDGSDVDSGTAAEIGYAYALKKPIFGYRNDFRYAGDNFGSRVNLQVEYFILASGGKIFRSIDEVNDFFQQTRSKTQ